MYSPSQIARILHLPERGKKATLEDFQVDSRKVTRPEHTLFFCLPGVRRHGHEFVIPLINKGVRYFVVEQGFEPPGSPGIHYFEVPDTLKALQQIAQYHRAQYKGRVLGITGSNGKTMVKEWLGQLLSPHLILTKSPGSYNSQIGLPLSLLQIKGDEDLVIIEAGVSQQGEMSNLRKMLQPDYGIFTMLGSAHDAGFADREVKLREKTSLFEKAEWWLSEGQYACFFRRHHVDIASLNVRWEDIGQGGQTRFYAGDTSMLLPFSDPASRMNFRLVLGFISLFSPELLDRLDTTRLYAVEMRSQLRKGVRGNTVLSDHYNADIEGLANVLDFAREAEPTKKKLLIVSDFMDVKIEENLLSSKARVIEESDVDMVWLIGPQAGQTAEKLKGKPAIDFRTTDEVLATQNIRDIKETLIILKGARIFEFEKIERMLVQPVFGTVLQIDFDALHHNWLLLKNQVSSGVKNLAMIKAAAYGSGLKEIGLFLQKHRADYLGVAYPNEGVFLREAGVKLPILVMHTESEGWDMMYEYDLEPVLHNFDQLIGLQDRFSGLELRVHLNINTGMNRLGFDPEEVDPLCHLLGRMPNLHCLSIMSHLSAADDPSKDDFTNQQLQRFLGVYESIADTLGYRPLRHIANSAAGLRLPHCHLDMVRWGLAMYGISETRPQRKVHTFKTHVVQVRRVAKGGSIGYGRHFLLEEDRTIATIPVGYADGLPRRLSDGLLTVIIRDVAVPCIGKICMDMTMIDVTHVAGVCVGDEVEIFGEKQSIQYLADQAQTIPYEIISSISTRVERVFLNA